MDFGRLSRASTLTALAFTSVAAFTSVSPGPGPLFVWGTGAPAPVGEYVALAAAGGSQVLAIRADGTLYLSGGTGAIPPITGAAAGTLATDRFCGVGMGRNHLLAIRPGGSLAVWGDWFNPTVTPATLPPDTTGRFVAVTGGGGHSVALDTTGSVVIWGTDTAAIGTHAPAGLTFKAIAAKGRYTLALSTDGNIYGWGADSADAMAPKIVRDVFAAKWQPDGTGHFIAPLEVGNPYIGIAAGLDLVVGLRANGSVVVWNAQTVPPLSVPAPPAGIAFTHIAAGRGYVAGIDQTGKLHAWGDPARVPPGAAPAGIYSAVSASNAYVTAMAWRPHVPITWPFDTTAPVVTDLTVNFDTLWPPNHKMATGAVTFRADDNCWPVELDRLSVTLRSNEPDNGFGSGNTTGDTNGHDGYFGPVAVPTTSIVQNADGSFTATFQLRAETAGSFSGPRTYTVSITATDNASSPNVSAPVAAQMVVASGGK